MRRAIRPDHPDKTLTASDRARLSLIFGKVLRDFRKRKGLTQEQLAEAAGLDRTTPSLYERGLRQPSLVSLLMLSDALEIEVDRLIRTIIVELAAKQ